jgi:hypothetical protein
MKVERQTDRGTYRKAVERTMEGRWTGRQAVDRRMEGR